MDALIKQLAEAWGPPGYEHPIRDLIRAEVAPLADEVRVDPLGNLICRIGDGPKRIMTAAHMDEIGLIVSHIDRQGYARFAPLGGLYPASLLSARVRFENGVIGTIGVEHQRSRRRELPSFEGFYIDISQGTDRDGNVNADVQVGDPAAFVGDVIWRGDRVIGKSLDNRLGCAVQIEVMRRIKESGTPHTVYCVFTVQEEVGSRGAGPAAYTIEPDIALALDVSPTGDEPHGRDMDVQLGGGPAIGARDASLITLPVVRDWLVRRAADAGIPYQTQILVGGGTDARYIQVAKAGVLTGVIAVPIRYVHTRSETADRGDIQATVDLLVTVLSGDVPGAG